MSSPSSLARLLLHSTLFCVAIYLKLAAEPPPSETLQPEKEGKSAVWRFLHKYRRALLAAFCVILFLFELPRPYLNHYEVLGCSSPQAGKSEIKHLYRSLAKKIHPDRSSSPSGSAPPLSSDHYYLFQQLTLSHDTLMSDARRSVYRLFGDLRPDGESTDTQSLSILVVVLSVCYHIVCFIIGYIASMVRPFQHASSLILLYSVSLFCLELHLRFVEASVALIPSVPLIGHWLPFEQIELLKRIFPTVLGLSVYISSHWLYKDVEMVTIRMLHGVLQTNMLICQRVGEILSISNAAGEHHKNGEKAKKLMDSSPLIQAAKEGQTANTPVPNNQNVTPPSMSPKPTSKEVRPQTPQVTAEQSDDPKAKFIDSLSPENQQEFNDLMTTQQQKSAETPWMTIAVCVGIFAVCYSFQSL